ncbi:uncharacterized protein [Pseudochaenichthys georgianus]|uniref:uncharacterized protein n=1 Tax=Pseudochaenichthys georgianus TaxID=52239 RepID=UPI00146BBDD9|nr:uncharacterized protein LOC117439641 [Pseudochaenichthys georgianus]
MVEQGTTPRNCLAASLLCHLSYLHDIKTKLPIQCVDNAEGFSPVVVYGDETFDFYYQQDAAQQHASEEGPYSSVRPFRPDRYENEDAAGLSAGLDEEQNLPVRCVDNADGFRPVVFYGDETFESDAAQQHASEEGPYSSVRPFRPDRYENEDAAGLSAGLDEEQNVHDFPSGVWTMRMDFLQWSTTVMKHSKVMRCCSMLLEKAPTGGQRWIVCTVRPFQSERCLFECRVGQNVDEY